MQTKAMVLVQESRVFQAVMAQSPDSANRFQDALELLAAFHQFQIAFGRFDPPTPERQEVPAIRE